MPPLGAASPVLAPNSHFPEPTSQPPLRTRQRPIAVNIANKSLSSMISRGTQTDSSQLGPIPSKAVVLVDLSVSGATSGKFPRKERRRMFWEQITRKIKEQIRKRAESASSTVKKVVEAARVSFAAGNPFSFELAPNPVIFGHLFATTATAIDTRWRHVPILRSYDRDVQTPEVWAREKKNIQTESQACHMVEQPTKSDTVLITRGPVIESQIGPSSATLEVGISNCALKPAQSAPVDLVCCGTTFLTPGAKT